MLRQHQQQSNRSRDDNDFSHSQQPQSSAKKRRVGATRSDRDWERGFENANPQHEDNMRASGSNVKLDASFISADVASNLMRRFITTRAKAEGFEYAETPALARLECEVTAFVEQMFSRAKAYAEIASRSRPTATDVLAAAEEYDLPISALKEEAREHKKRLRNRMLAGDEISDLKLRIEPPMRQPPSPELLESDDEDVEAVPRTLRALPAHLPPLPPKHTYLRTPVPPPKKQALPSLEKKLENAALVQKSLRGLLLATEVDTDANDGELFGGVVNWEATRYPRKKWKVKVAGY